MKDKKFNLFILICLGEATWDFNYAHWWEMGEVYDLILFNHFHSTGFAASPLYQISMYSRLMHSLAIGLSLRDSMFWEFSWSNDYEIMEQGYKRISVFVISGHWFF